MSVGESLKQLFQNKNYIFLFLCFNFLYGLYSAIASSISSFTTPYNFDSSDNSIICLVFLISGILFSFFIGTILDKYQCYRKSLIGICIGSLITLSLTFYGLPTEKLIVEAVIMMLTGAAIIPIVTISFSLAAELTYPVPEVYSIGTMISVAQIFGAVLVSLINVNFLQGVVMSIICEQFDPLYGVGVWVICAFFSMICAFFVKGNL